MPQIKSFQVDSTIITEEDLGVRVQDYNPEIVTVKNNFAGAVAPSTSDDDVAGYEIGSRWVDIATDNEYVCLDATTSNAVWAKTTNTSVGINDNSDTVAMTITSAEDIGIGETVPLGKLHIKTGDAGAISPSGAANELVLENSTNTGMSIFSGTTGQGYVIFGDADNDTVGYLLYDHTANYFAIQTNASEVLRIDSSGNVGIGETSPLGKLHVKESDTGLVTANTLADEFVIETNGTGGMSIITTNISTGYILFGDPFSTAAGQIFYDHSAESMNFVSDAALTMTLDASNNVGIGITSPDGKLHVHSGTAGTITANTSANELVLEGSGHTGMHILCPDTFQNIIYFGTPTRNLGALVAWDYTSNVFSLGSNNAAGQVKINSSNNIEAIRIDGSQNVGIGTTLPDGRLHAHASSCGTVTAHVNANTIVAEAGLSNGISILVPDGSSSIIMFGSPSSNRGAELNWVYNSSSFLVTTRKVGAELQLGSGNAITAMTIDSSQNVGIGVAPVRRLHLHESTASTNHYLHFSNSTSGTTTTDGFDIGIVANDTVAVWNRENTDMRFATNNSEGMRLAANGDVGIGETIPLGKLHVKTADSGASAVSSAANELVVEGATATGISIVGGASSIMSIMFGDSAVATAGRVYYNNSSNAMSLWTNAVERISITSSGDVGISETVPLGKLHIKSADSGATSVLSSGSQLVLEHSAASGLTILSGTSSDSGIYFGDSGNSFIGRLVYSHSLESLRFWTGSSQRGYITLGLVLGSPAGGDKGAGTLNASGVYDDNVLLTCYVFDQAVDGSIVDTKWDDKVPDRVITEEGSPEITETRIHDPMRKFKSRIGTEYDPMDIDKYSQHWKDKKHLTSMPNEATFDPVDGAMASGEWIQRLIETVEIQAVHIDTLNQKNKELEARLTALEGGA